ncbi:MAG: hypothetical protein WD872_11070 [Pirellulaceae bacterium]
MPSKTSSSKTKSRRLASAADPTDAHESRGAVALTVAWMLLTLSCLAAQLVALTMWLIARSVGVPANRPNALLLIPSTLMIVATLTGIAVLALTGLIYRVRRARPPLPVTVAALLIALAPLAIVGVLALADF